jgi:hypothetical protein
MKTKTTFIFNGDYILCNKKELKNLNIKKRTIDVSKVKMPLPRVNNPIIDSCLMDF